MGETLTKSALIDCICETYRLRNGAELPPEDIDLAVRSVIDAMTAALADGERIEIRGFGSFSLHYRKARIGRNPKTGESVGLSDRQVPFFKPGKELRSRVNFRGKQGLD